MSTKFLNCVFSNVANRRQNTSDYSKTENLSISSKRLFSDVAKKQNIAHVNFTTFFVGGGFNLKFRTLCITRKYFTNIIGIHYPYQYYVW